MYRYVSTPNARHFQIFKNARPLFFVTEPQTKQDDETINKNNKTTSRLTYLERISIMFFCSHTTP
jgi:hypothetical protein